VIEIGEDSVDLTNRGIELADDQEVFEWQVRFFDVDDGFALGNAAFFLCGEGIEGRCRRGGFPEQKDQQATPGKERKKGDPHVRFPFC
jgi:hypothetical protein